MALRALALPENNLRISLILAASGPRSGHSKGWRWVKKVMNHGPDVIIGGVWFQRRLKRVAQTLPTIEEVCRSQEIPFYVQENMNDAKTEDLISSLAPDFVISLGNGWLSKRIYGPARISALNVHHELLPEFPGAPPVIHSLASGKLVTGYTIHELTPQLDRGPVIARAVLPISVKDTLASTIEDTIRLLYQASAQELASVLTSFPQYQETSMNPSRNEMPYTTPSLREILRARRVWKSQLGVDQLSVT